MKHFYPFKDLLHSSTKREEYIKRSLTLLRIAETIGSTLTRFYQKEDNDKPTILLVSPFTFFGRKQGGAIRTNNIIRVLLEKYTVISVEFCWEDQYKIEASQATDGWMHFKCSHINDTLKSSTEVKADSFHSWLTREMSVLLSGIITSADVRLLWIEFSFMGVYSSIATLHNIPFILSLHNIENQLIAEIHSHEDQDCSSYSQSTHSGPDLNTIVEKSLIARSEHIIVTTKRDRDYCCDYNERARVSVAPNIVDFNIPIQDAYPRQMSSDLVSNTSISLSFVGDLCYQPNISGIKWLLESILCRLSLDHLNLFQLDIYGRGSLDITIPKELANVFSHGFAPDINDCYRNADAVIIPLLHGGGSRLKAYEAISRNKPILSTEKGVEGIDISSLSDFIYIFNDIDSMASCVHNLKHNLQDHEYLSRMDISYRKFYEESVVQFSSCILDAADSALQSRSVS